MVYITAANFEDAEKIARGLVEERLAACTNLVPKIISTYWWDDKLNEDQESLILAKTTNDKVDALIERVKEMHSYEVPAVSVIEIKGGNPDFLNWIESVVSK
jgi:periplasmic divalent cation tolerance protein